MKGIFVPFEIALALKSVGFNQLCYSYYLTNEENSRGHLNHVGNWIPQDWNTVSERRISAPIYQQVIDWFRETHNVDIFIKTECTVNEITGFLGHIHVLMSYPAVFIKVLGKTIEDNFSYYTIMHDTITEAVKFIKDNQA